LISTSQLLDESGKEITGGEIEAEAWEYFHNYKYETENGNVDFIAELKYKLEGGRTTPALPGYRPQIKFEFEEMQTSGQQQFINRKLVFPGDKVVAKINILSVDHFAKKLEEGMEFEFREGSRIIGHGKILTIVNKKLKKEASK
jgi:translation elongation factor EF-Tu-like GTPase